MNTHTYLKTALAFSPIVISLVILAAVSVTDSAYANVKGSTNDGCTNGGGQDVGGKTTCPSSPPQTQDTCNATTGNGKCPKGQN